MKRLLHALVLVAALATTTAKADTDRVLLFLSSTLLLMDWGQTRYIAQSSDFWDINPILGRHPSTTTVDTYFASAMLGNFFAGRIIPQPYLNTARAVLIGLEMGRVAHNYTIGVKWGF